jgi:mRNA interferase RelE/StbE
MQVLLRPVAEKYLERLNEPDKGRIKNALEDLSKDPPEGDIRPLTGQPGYWRLRVSGYRALYSIENNTIFVTNIEPRSQAYTKKERLVMETAALRKELQGYIATMPERNLYALKPLLSVLAESSYIVEPANADEIALIDKGMAEYRANPSSFVPLESIR